MKVTTEFLQSKNACSPGMIWVTENNLIGLEGKEFVEKLIASDKLDWGHWLIVRLMDHANVVRYVIFAAEQVIEIYENKYPDDNRPRKAIEAARAYLANPSDENKKATHAAAAAAHAAYAAAAAADAAYAADAAAAAAYAAADAAHAAADAAHAADAAAADAARKEIKIRILNYGLTLI